MKSEENRLIAIFHRQWKIERKFGRKAKTTRAAVMKFSLHAMENLGRISKRCERKNSARQLVERVSSRARIGEKSAAEDISTRVYFFDLLVFQRHTQWHFESQQRGGRCFLSYPQALPCFLLSLLYFGVLPARGIR